jgi:transcriptional regulator with XRE-family HTH domain
MVGLENQNPLRTYRLSQTPPLKLDDLAERVGTTKANLSRIETGKQLVSEALLPKLVAETGISARVLRPDLAELFATPHGSGKLGGAAKRVKSDAA